MHTTAVCKLQAFRQPAIKWPQMLNSCAVHMNPFQIWRDIADLKMRKPPGKKYIGIGYPFFKARLAMPKTQVDASGGLLVALKGLSDSFLRNIKNAVKAWVVLKVDTDFCGFGHCIFSEWSTRSRIQ